MLRFLQNAGAVIWAILAVPFLLFGMIFKPGDFLPVGGFWKFLLGIVLAQRTGYLILLASE